MHYKHHHRSSLTPDQGQQIVDLYEAGRTIPEVALEVGVGYEIVRTALHRSRVELRPRDIRSKNIFPLEKVAWIVEQYTVEGKSALAIARELTEQGTPITHGPVLRILREQGLSSRDRRDKTAHGAEKLREVLKARWEAGDEALGHKFGDPVSEETKEKMRASARRGANNLSWKGGRIESRGYIYLYVPYHPSVQGKSRKYIGEHRLVMEKVLGRLLRPDEMVHHKNGIKWDNRPENLVVVAPTSHYGEVVCPHCQSPFLIK